VPNLIRRCHYGMVRRGRFAIKLDDPQSAFLRVATRCCDANSMPVVGQQRKCRSLRRLPRTRPVYLNERTRLVANRNSLLWANCRNKGTLAPEVVEVRGLRPFARAGKQCSIVVELPVGRAEYRP
jgi:hypothetical protein